MARKTIEQQEIIRQAFITKLQKKKSEPFFQCSVFLSGAAKNKFIIMNLLRDIHNQS